MAPSDRGKFFQLIFKGINYRADVWLNGKQLADSSQMAGMFAEYSLDAGSAIDAGATNVLAVKIYPLDFPGLPAHPQLTALGDFYNNGGANGDIGKNITMLCSVGWDWIPEVHDRNIGIWQPVYLRTSGRVIIQQPQIIAQLPQLPDTNIASLSLNLAMVNHSNTAANGKLRITITPETFSGSAFTVEQNVSISANYSKNVNLTSKDTKQFTIRKPHLWWPNGYGSPDLYRMRIQYLDGPAALPDCLQPGYGRTSMR